MDHEAHSETPARANSKTKNLGCLALIVVVILAVVMMVSSSNKKTRELWEAEKGELLPQLQELAEKGKYEELLEKSDRFQIIKDDQLVKLREEAKKVVEKKEAEKKAKEEEEAKKNTPQGLVEQEIHKGLGDGKWKPLESVEIEEDGKVKTAVIRFEVKGKKSSTGSQMMDDIGKLVEAAMKVEAVGRVTIHPMVASMDDLGNKGLKNAATLTLDRETAEKVKWKNLGDFEKFAVFEKYGQADLTELFPEIE